MTRKTRLALWGVANSYDTGPLRDLKPGENNDALFTDTTLAFEPRTGKLRLVLPAHDRTTSTISTGCSTA